MKKITRKIKEQTIKIKTKKPKWAGSCRKLCGRVGTPTHYKRNIVLKCFVLYYLKNRKWAKWENKIVKEKRNKKETEKPKRKNKQKKETE